MSERSRRRKRESQAPAGAAVAARRKSAPPPAPGPMGAAAAELREGLFAQIALLLTVYLFATFIYFLSVWSPPAAQDASLSFLPGIRGEIAPEPLERFAYLTGLAFIPVVPLLWYLALNRSRWARDGDPAEQKRFWAARDIVWVLGVGSWLGVLAARGEIPGITRCLMFAVLPAFLLDAVPARIPVKACVIHAAAGLLALFFGLSLMVSDVAFQDDFIGHHMDMLLGAVNGVSDGRTVLADISSQYGILYPYFAALFTKVFGVTVPYVGLFFAILTALSLAFIYLALARKTAHEPLWGLVIFAAVIGLTHPIYEWYLFDFNDGRTMFPYYQYLPIRVLFGAFFIWFAREYALHPSRWRLLTGYALAGAALLWNVDTGLIVLIAWTGTAAFSSIQRDGLSPRRITKTVFVHAALLVASALIWIIAYSLFARVRSGRFPDWFGAIRFQRLFYGGGFYMLPMRLWEFWQPIILIYAVVVFTCLRRLVQRRATAETSWYLFLALFGLGAFSYYQGRSHRFCLLPVMYPAVVLSGCLFVDALARLRGKRFRVVFADPLLRQEYLKMALFSLIVLTGAAGFLGGLPAAVRYGGRVVSAMRQEYRRAVLDALRDRIGGAPALILATRPNFIHLKTGIPSALPYSSPQEVVAPSQVREIQRLLDSGAIRYVVLDKRGAYLTEYLSFRHFRLVMEMDGTLRLLEYVAPQQQ